MFSYGTNFILLLEFKFLTDFPNFFSLSKLIFCTIAREVIVVISFVSNSYSRAYYTCGRPARPPREFQLVTRAPSIVLMSPTNLITRQNSDCCNRQDGREMSVENRFVFRCAADRVGVVAAFDLPN